MDKFIYQGKFNLSNQITKDAFAETQSELNVFSDLSEMISENFECQVMVDVKVRLSSTKGGLVTMTATRKLTDEELDNITNFIAFEVNEDGLNDVFGQDVSTVNGDGYTQLVWNGDENSFKLVNQYIAKVA